MQDNETTNSSPITDTGQIPDSGRILALDPGTSKAGIAVSDPDRIVIRRVGILPASNWKKLLAEVRSLIDELDAVALIVGLPLNTDGSESEMSERARRFAKNFSLSLPIPVHLQDERVTTWQARRNLWETGKSVEDAEDDVDAEAAALILEDFLAKSARR